MKLRVFTVDAFTSVQFAGNPAAVIPLDEKLPDDLMQKIASEMNLSETAFLEPKDSPTPECWSSGYRFGLRWMTPLLEVKLCGHATLASAQVLFSELGNTSSEIEFETLSGVLLVRRRGDEIILDLPLSEPVPLTPAHMEVCVPLIKETMGSMKVEEVHLSEEATKLIICLDETYTRKDLESLGPPITEKLLRLHDGTLVKGIVVTLRGELSEGTSSRGIPDHHFISRYFGAWNGIREDPVTGSAHNVLGPFWARKLNLKDLKCRQCSPRGGELTLKIRDKDGRVDVAGKAVTVLNGFINVED